MNRLLSSEWQRMNSRRKNILFFSIFMVYILAQSLLAENLFFTMEESVPLNSLNYSIFLLKKIYYLMVLIILPVLCIDSINGEYQSGGLRLVAIRPLSLKVILFAKWFLLIGMVAVIMVITFAVGTASGYIFYPKADSVSFYYENAPVLGVAEAYIYQLKYYLGVFFIFIALIGIASLLSVILPNTIISVITYLFLLFISVYLSDVFDILLFGSQEMFVFLLEAESSYLWFLILVIVLTYSFTLLRWNSRDWVK
ncbi:ABC-type transport system involved in multi-copper enzyme maturation permease subunit [Bacillus thermophilus]|uniref:ABC-type transport system involved in multi-copper enzyme maturation permease subunit n=1 Tax=Siminovitchia thermophila TaxID=1245522 RepID=A0ABS2R5W7_9BACI|nr:hypothetical protein [Siminovitchia thermophila]MBM7714534.1 ABC-type transport system involved in multi-copper enzyme maturation permease subunit [Siminovitchia thermophila]ONK22599.1 hypothetical protein BLX87_14515 [Bacillus sp. VT-16-64]